MFNSLLNKSNGTSDKRKLIDKWWDNVKFLDMMIAKQEAQNPKDASIDVLNARKVTFIECIEDLSNTL